MLFFRIARTNPPTIQDFVSQKANGVPLRDVRYASIWDGVSVYETDVQAENAAARARYRFGSYLCVLDVEENGLVQFERTTGSAGHHTLWATPEQLLACVVATTRLRGDEGPIE